MVVGVRMQSLTQSALRSHVRSRPMGLTRAFSKSAGKPKKGPRPPNLVIENRENGVRVITMNTPKRLNAWTYTMMRDIKQQFKAANDDPEVKGIVFTGTGRYYCAGVDLSAMMKPMLPKTLYNTILTANQTLFQAFIDVDKPFVVAANGHAVGAAVTSGTLIDAYIAMEDATFTTPFFRLGVCPEGCSSVHFERIMGKETAERMLGEEGWTPTAKEWHEIGVLEQTVPRTVDASLDPETLQAKDEHKLVETAIKVCEKYIANGKKYTKEERDELTAINARESIELAECFLSYKFLDAQYEFARTKGKEGIARAFYIAKQTRPAWSLML